MKRPVPMHPARAALLLSGLLAAQPAARERNLVFYNYATGRREDCRDHCKYGVDDAAAERNHSDAPANARYIGWYDPVSGQPVFVAVWSYLPNTTVGHSTARELAHDLLQEKGFIVPERSPYCF